MRVLGGGMILGGCFGLGLWYREQLLGRIRALRNLTVILEMFMSEIRYGKSTFPESCRHLSGRMEEPYGSCMEQIWREMQEKRGASFQTAFCGRMRECFRELPLQQEDVEIFLQPFSESGFQDGSMQLRTIEQSLEQIVRIIRINEEEQQKKCRMMVGLGAMSGIFLIIILL